MNSLILIDAYGFLFRAFHALPPLINHNGDPVGAVYGFLNMLLKAFSEHQATHWVAVCDTGKKTFRENIYSEYKANRGEPDDDLIPQFDFLKEALNAFNIKYIAIEGYEADDVIATLATSCTSMPVTIISSDKDLMQLVGGNVCMFDPMKSKFIGDKEVFEKFGVHADKLLDCFALIGDKSDNIPGVPGIGPKTAALLINQFESLENLIKNLDQIPQKKRRETLEQNIEQAYLSRKLAKLVTDVDIGCGVDDFLFKPPQFEHVIQFLHHYGLKGIINKVEQVFYPQVTKKQTFIEVKNKQDIESLILECKTSGVLSIAAQFTQTSDMIFGISSKMNNYLLSSEKIHLLNDILMSPEILKITYNAKLLLKYFQFYPYDDVSVMAYTIDTTKQSLQDLFYHYLGEQLSIEVALQAADFVKLREVLKGKLFDNKVVTLYERLDKCAIAVLDSVEKNGIAVDVGVLEGAAQEFTRSINEIEEDIFKIVGYRFNIASSQKLSEALFNDMGIQGGKKLKSGKYSTDSEVLESIASQGVEVAEKILAWRHFSKLKNTYTGSLLSRVNRESGRIHTTYSITSTSTSRLSSSNPNLQNLPKAGVIRKAFVAEKGSYLISADYSQIELRLLAHIANIVDLQKTLISGDDLHSVAAQQIFGEVNDDLRHKAKAINFGIIYGISAFGLAKQLNISNSEAQEYITNYFNRYPGIEKYMSDMVAYARSNRYVKTIYGRRCYVPDIHSKSIMIQKFAERAAINAPLQGSAADIMKDGMIKVFKKLTSGSIVLQVHDELVIESPKEKLEENANLIKSILENVVRLKVPMQVNISYGENLGELKSLC